MCRTFTRVPIAHLPCSPTVMDTMQRSPALGESPRATCYRVACVIRPSLPIQASLMMIGFTCATRGLGQRGKVDALVSDPGLCMPRAYNAVPPRTSQPPPHLVDGEDVARLTLVERALHGRNL
jgi:hypothetical protein